MEHRIQLLIYHGNIGFEPVIDGKIEYKTVRKGTPGQLDFSVLLDDILIFEEGDAVSLKVNDSNIFFGFIFKKSSAKDKLVSVTAYDQLRYLKYKDTYPIRNKRADEIVRMIAEDFGLKTGTLENTGYTIPSKIEDNKTLFDIIQNALDDTLMNRGKIYCLYDDYGKITLRNIENMMVGFLIDQETTEDYDYSTSIDGETYNRIKLSRENDRTGKREIYIEQHGENINKWGTLQYYDTLKENENGVAKAQALLKLYNQKEQKLSLSGVLGDSRIHAGVSVYAKFNLRDRKVDSFMVVEECKHSITSSNWQMDLKLSGGGFVG